MSPLFIDCVRVIACVTKLCLIFRYQQKTTDSCGSPNEAFQSAINDMESFRPPSSTGSNAHSKILAIHFVKPCAQTLLSDLFVSFGMWW